MDDHPVVRRGLQLLFDEVGRYHVLGGAGSIASAKSSLVELQPDVVVVDIGLGDGDGLDLVGWIRDRLPRSRAMVLTMYDDEFLAGPALEAGAFGLVSKSTSECDLIRAVDRVSLGEVALDERSVNSWLRRAVDQTAAPGRSQAQLSKRELQVYRLMGEGRGPKEIASQLNIATKTVEAYQTKLKARLGLDSTREVRRQAGLWVSGRPDGLGEGPLDATP